MGDVFQYLIDGTSGIVTGGVDGKALVAGVCSKGQVGKGYMIGQRTDLEALLGVGPLVDRVRDMLVTGGQNPYLVAVPVKGQPCGYISALSQHGDGSPATLSGYPAQNADVLVRVSTAGALGTAELEVSLDGGKTYAEPVTSATQNVLGDTGVTLIFASDAELEVGTSYACSVRCPVGPVYRTGDADSPMVEVGEASGGAVLAGAELVVQIVRGGTLNEGTFRLSTDGGDSFERTRTIPVDGKYRLPFGVVLTFPAGTYAAGTTYTCRLLPPAPSIVDVLDALESPLAIHDVEFVYIVGESDSVDWLAAQAKAEELWGQQRPTYFKMETRLPYDHEDMSDFAAWLLSERQGIAARFVTVCPQWGEVVDTTGQARLRNAAGLQAGRVMAIPVQRAAGRVKDGPVSQLALPDGWEAIQPALEDAGFITARQYASMNGTYWAGSRTLADETSDYRWEEPLRTVFRAVRLTRVAALKSLNDELGDPMRVNNQGGLAYLKANLENALDVMVGAGELAAYRIDIPVGQDIVNNGVQVEVSLIGIPIIREIHLFNKYVYAGSRFDSRMTDED